MSKPIIQVENISKQYHIGLKEKANRTFREALVDTVAAPVKNFNRLRKLNKVETAETPDIIWALKDVSFEVQPGEVVGIIGCNGAGKSTLLKILSRITEPTSGDIKLHGRVASLLEVGTGFHPELTGRENIYLNGTILGMRRSEIDRKFDEIVAFSEIEKFLDTPVKRYSSGMYVRLAFAVAAHLEPEILLVDEVLAVGDAAFQKKCLGKMGDVAKEGRTVLFVSHNMAAIQHLCPIGLLLSEGNAITHGPVDDCINTYITRLPQSFKNNKTFQSKKKAFITDINLIQDNGIISTILCNNPATINIKYTVSQPLKNPYIRLTIYNSQGLAIAGLATEDTNFTPNSTTGNHSTNCKIHTLNLIPGAYHFNVSISDDSGECDKQYNTCNFNIEGSDIYGTGKILSSKTGLITLNHNWL